MSADITPEQIEACRLHIEAEHASGRPDAVEGETALAIIAVCQRLMGDVLSLSAKLDAPCGSCHPCTNYADETWRAAGRKPPHVYEWDESRAEVKRLEGRLGAAEAVMWQSLRAVEHAEVAHLLGLYFAAAEAAQAEQNGGAR